MSLIRKIVSLIANESAVVMYGLNALVTAWVAFGFRATPGQTAAVTTIGAAIVTIVTAFATRPVSVPVITGAVATIATAAAAFGLHLSSAQIGAGVPVLALVLSLVLRQAVIPLVTLKRQEAALAWEAAPGSHEPEHTLGVAQRVEHTGRLMSDEDLEALAGRLAQTIRRRAPRAM